MGIEGVILFDSPGHPEAIIPQLCVELHCLPSQLKNEKYEDVHAIITVLQCLRKKEKKSSNVNL